MITTVEKKLHTIKVLLVVCLLTNLIRAIRFNIGQTHDFEMYKKAKFDFPSSLKVSVDLGFLGIKNLHKNVEMPSKSSKLKQLTDEQKLQNKNYSSKRVTIEHINRSCKIFKVCGNKYRGKHKNYEETWKIITALVNLKNVTHNLRYETI
jgi:predicted KAP-like P-loop ATPase